MLRSFVDQLASEHVGSWHLWYPTLPSLIKNLFALFIPASTLISDHIFFTQTPNSQHFLYKHFWINRFIISIVSVCKIWFPFCAVFLSSYYYPLQVRHQPKFLRQHHSSSIYNAHGHFFNKSNTMFIYSSRHLSSVGLASCPTQSQCFSIYSLGRSGARSCYMPHLAYIVAATSGVGSIWRRALPPHFSRHLLNFSSLSCSIQIGFICRCALPPRST